jgi:hypothetical protein
MQHVPNTTKIYPIRFVQGSNVTSYNLGKEDLYHDSILGMSNVPIILLWWCDQSASLLKKTQTKKVYK